MIIYAHFIYVKVLVKIFPFNSILDFAILSVFKIRTVIMCEVGSSVGFQTAKSLAPIAPSPIF